MSLLFDRYVISDNFNNASDAVLLEGDTSDVLKRLPDDTFKLIVPSPPYNIGKVYEKEVSLEEYLAWQEKIIVELYRTCHTNGSIVWQVGNYVDGGGYMKIVAEYNFNGGKEFIGKKYKDELLEEYRVINSVNALNCKTKISKEKTMPGKNLYSPNGYRSAATSKTKPFRDMDFIKHHKKLGIAICGS